MVFLAGTYVDGDPVADTIERRVLGNLEVPGERRAADGAQIDGQLHVPPRAERPGDALRRLQLGGVALPVAEAERVELEALLPGHGPRGSGVHPSAHENDCFGCGHGQKLPPQHVSQRRLQRRMPEGVA